MQVWEGGGDDDTIPVYSKGAGTKQDMEDAVPEIARGTFFHRPIHLHQYIFFTYVSMHACMHAFHQSGVYLLLRLHHCVVWYLSDSIC